MRTNARYIVVLEQRSNHAITQHNGRDLQRLKLKGGESAPILFVYIRNEVGAKVPTVSLGGMVWTE